MSTRVVIIGNGVAGNTAASAVRKLDREAAITMLSAEPFPHYSACILADCLSGEIERERVFLKSTADYAQEGIEVLLGEKAVSLDTGAKRVLLESGHIPYDKVILATGSKPVVPPLEGVDKKGVFTFKSLGDADAISHYDTRRAVVIGSGPVGIEAAIALRKRGYQVSMVELLGWVLPRVLDERPAQMLKDLLEEQGIQVLTKEKVVRIIGGDSVEGVVTDQREIKCELVVLVVGMQPEASLAREAGIEVGKLRGIKVDERMLTSTEDVYACGDCIQAKDWVTGEDSLSLLWHNARYQGRVAGQNCVGSPRTYPGSQDITVVNFWEANVVSLGKTSTSPLYPNADIIEKRLGGAYYCLVLSQGKLVGIQCIGHPKDMGVLLNLIRRQDPLQGLEQLVLKNAPLSAGSWRVKVPRYISYGS